MIPLPIEISEGLKVGPGCPFLLIAGPCVIEELETCRQIAATCRDLTQKIGLSYVFKASFDKANRTSHTSYRGPGMKKGLEILAAIKDEFNLPVLTDIHEPSQAAPVAEVVDILQIPAFLCRQTDLLVAAGETGKVVNIKKGQFCSAGQMVKAAAKVASTGNQRIMLTERGNSFGYGNLVVDMRNLVFMREAGYPVVFDATHAVQLPGGLGDASGGDRRLAPPLARAAVAVGVDALFLEVHPQPDKALSDGPNSLKLDDLEPFLIKVKAIDAITRT